MRELEVERRQGERLVVHYFDGGAAGAEQDHGPEFAIVHHPGDQFEGGGTPDHGLHGKAVDTRRRLRLTHAR